MLGSIYYECGTEASCEAAYTFKVMMTTVWCLIVLLAFPTGAHLNCTITTAAFAWGELPFASLIANIGAQLLGSVAAMEAIRFLAPPELHKHVGAPSPPGGDLAVGFALEVAFTFANVVAAFASADIWGDRLKAVGTASIVVAEITIGGAQMDPSGAFAAAYFNNAWANHVEVYWGGAILGAVLAGLFWRSIEAAKATGKAKTE